MRFIEKCKRELWRFIEFKGVGGRRRELTKWDFAFTAIIIALILGLGLLLVYLGIIRSQ